MAKDIDQPAAYVVLESFGTEIDGVPVTYRKGEPVHPDDPALKKWPKAFGPLVFPHALSARPSFAEKMAAARAAKAIGVLSTPELRAS